MLTKADEKRIRIIFKESFQESFDDAFDKATEGMKLSLVNIERDREVLKDIWDFVKEHTTQLKDHEQRLTDLEAQQL